MLFHAADHGRSTSVMDEICPLAACSISLSCRLALIVYRGLEELTCTPLLQDGKSLMRALSAIRRRCVSVFSPLRRNSTAIRLPEG